MKILSTPVIYLLFLSSIIIFRLYVNYAYPLVLEVSTHTTFNSLCFVIFLLGVAICDTSPVTVVRESRSEVLKLDMKSSRFSLGVGVSAISIVMLLISTFLFSFLAFP